LHSDLSVLERLFEWFEEIIMELPFGRGKIPLPLPASWQAEVLRLRRFPIADPAGK